jgi:hypothetical protein
VFAERPEPSFRFAVFGDQRALADGEWQEVIARIDELPAERAPHFLLDTGDCVENGSHSDQFWFLRDLLHPVRRLPYLVGIGNHELHNNDGEAGRENTARFLSYLDPELSPRRFYYRKDLGPAVFLFLDTNIFTYGEDGERDACPLSIHPQSDAAEQLAWLRRQAAEVRERKGPVIAVFHHPFVQSSKKHAKAAAALWNFDDNGQGLATILADAGVDIILVGHTHTYERFRIERLRDGHVMHLVNVSGRPRNAALWIGSGARRARDIRCREHEALRERGWRKLDDWRITQETFLAKDDEANQFVLFDVDADGGIRIQARFLDEDAPDGTRHGPEVPLH